MLIQQIKPTDKVRKGKRIATIKKVDSPEKGYLDVEFEDEKNNGSYSSQYFRKITETLNTNILKELVQKYPYHTVGTIKQMAKELESLTDIGCVLEIRESNSWHSCYTIFKKKDINKWESTYICDGKLIEEQTWIATTYDVAENITSEDNRVNNITIKQETLESTKSIKETTMLLNKLNKAINEALEDELQVGDTVVLRGSQPLQLKRRGTIKKLNNETAVVEFPEIPEQDLMTREDTYYIDELEKVNE